VECFCHFVNFGQVFLSIDREAQQFKLRKIGKVRACQVYKTMYGNTKCEMCGEVKYLFVSRKQEKQDRKCLSPSMLQLYKYY
jgi:hypothetical protein